MLSKLFSIFFLFFAVAKLEKSTTTITSTVASSGTIRQQASGQGESSRAEGEPRGILKKTKSVESVTSDSNSIRPVPIQETAVSQDQAQTVQGEEQEEADRVSPVAELLVLTAEGVEDEGTGTPSFFLLDDGIGGESSTDPAPEEDMTSKASDRRRVRAADRKAQAERSVVVVCVCVCVCVCVRARACARMLMHALVHNGIQAMGVEICICGMHGLKFLLSFLLGFCFLACL